MELVADKGAIVAVMNEAILHGRTSIAIHSPFLELDLAGLDLQDGGKVRFLASERDLVNAQSTILGKLADPLDREVPGFSDYREALHASLLLPPTNLDELIAEIRAAEGRRNRPSRYPRQSCLALDTNLAYKRLLSRVILSDGACGVRELDPGKVQVLLSSMVEREVSERIGRKYTPQELGILRRAFRSPHLLEGLANCLHKDGRKAMNAMSELGAIRSKYAVWDVSGGEWREDKEARDAEILRSLAHHSRQENVDVLFITGDDKATAHAETAKVPSLVLRYPNEVPATVSYDPWLVSEFIYELAVTFGVVSLKGLGLRIMGDWAGKTAEDYRAERVKVAMEESSGLGSSLERDIRIVSRLRKEIDLAGLK